MNTQPQTLSVIEITTGNVVEVFTEGDFLAQIFEFSRKYGTGRPDHVPGVPAKYGYTAAGPTTFLKP